MALALVRRIVHRDEQALSNCTLPRKRYVAIPCPVSFPRRHTFEQLPLAVANDRLSKHRKQPVVKLSQPLVDGFFGRANQMRRDALRPAVELTLMEKPQTRRQKTDDRCRLVNLRSKGSRRPRLVVVLEKARHLVLIIKPRVKVLSHWSCVSFSETVV